MTAALLPVKGSSLSWVKQYSGQLWNMCFFVSYFLLTIAAQFIVTYFFLTITANPYVLQLNQRLNVLLTSSILSIVLGICAVLLAFFIIWFVTMWGRRSRENERDDSDGEDDNPGNPGSGFLGTRVEAATQMFCNCMNKAYPYFKNSIG